MSEFKVGDKVIYKCINGDRMGDWLPDNTEATVVSCDSCGYEVIKHPTMQLFSEKLNQFQWTYEINCTKIEEEPMGKEHTFKVGDHVELIREGSELTSTHVSLWDKGVVRKVNTDEWYASKLGLVLVVFNTSVGPRAQWVNPVNLRLVKEEKKEDYMLTKLKEKVAHYESRLSEAKRKVEEYQGFLNWLDQ